MAEKEAGSEEAPKKGKLPLILGVGVVALALGGGGAYFFLGKSAKEGDEAVVEKVSEPLQTSFVNLEPFTFNLLDEDQDRFARLAVVLEVVEPGVEAELKAVEPAIRDALLMLMTSKTSKRLLSVNGKEDLSYEIVAATNAILAGQPAPAIKIPAAKSKKTLKFKKSKTAYRDERRGDTDVDDRRSSRDDANEDDYREERRDRRSRRRAPVIPERVYDAHFSRFLIQ
jgi:flagellar FliL protein